MDFGDILDEWDKRSSKPGGLKGADEVERRLREAEASRLALLKEEERRKAAAKARARYSLESWLDEHGVEDKDGKDEPQAGGQASREAEARRLKDLKPQARLDLHGMRALEAEAALASFLEASSRAGLEKVLVVTGKGMHSQGEPVLGKTARRVLESSPFAGRFGQADPSEGGSGALWVIVRRKGYFSR
ncbi:MAG TPA: Smr/MutS family protein [Spirochaetia bacterium]|nr:Smr/MutS family protein [Spirochaetales bacterium]HRY72720.1 Smr/MutS family protein [Spirochaetia bacterium]